MRTSRLPILPIGAVILAEPGVPFEETLADLRQIRQLRFNTVVLYPSVSRWEGEPPGQTAFTTIDRIMDACAELGLSVILELQGQVMQDADAPECFGYAQSPHYRENGLHDSKKVELLGRYLREVATHFRGHPALLAYDLFNEIGNESRSPGTIRAFIEFLRAQYREIDALNLAWATYFRNFEAIADIPPNFTVWTWSSVLAERDWQRFRSRDFASKISEWRAIIREIDPDTPLFVDVLGSDVLQNRTDGYFGVSDWDAVTESDVLGLSCYANMLTPRWWDRQAWLWPQFWRHALSVAHGKQTIISELMTPNRSIFPTEHSSMEDELRLWSFQAIFHGIQGLIYWKYRPFRRGRQVAGRGLTDFAGVPNSQGAQAAEAAAFLNEHADALTRAVPDDGGCAILFDPEIERLFTAIGVGAGPGQASTFYTDQHRGWFRALWSQGLAPRYVTPDTIHGGVPESIRVLVAPCLTAASAELLKMLQDFVVRGGVLITDARFATLDENGNLWSQSPGGLLETNFSSRFHDALATPQGDLSFVDDYFQEVVIGDDMLVLQETRGGKPAILMRQIGAGRHLHLNFLLGQKIEAPETAQAALAWFPTLFEPIRANLAAQVEVLEKGAETDISTLLNPDGAPWLIGITNHAHHADHVELRFPSHDGILRCPGRPEISLTAGKPTRVPVNPRSAEAWFFQAGNITRS